MTNMIKRVIVLVLILIVGLIVLDAVILPQLAITLAIPSLATWTGLGGFLRLLPFILLVGLVVIYFMGLFRGNDDDEE